MDSIVLIGGEVSPGMELERRLAEAVGCTVVDLTDLGPEPPWPQEPPEPKQPAKGKRK